MQNMQSVQLGLRLLKERLVASFLCKIITFSHEAASLFNLVSV